MRVQAEAGAHRLLDAVAVEHRQHARKGGVDRRHLGIGLGAEVGGGAGKQLGLGDHLGVDLEAHHHLPVLGLATNSIASLRRFRLHSAAVRWKGRNEEDRRRYLSSGTTIRNSRVASPASPPQAARTVPRRPACGQRKSKAGEASAVRPDPAAPHRTEQSRLERRLQVGGKSRYKITTFPCRRLSPVMDIYLPIAELSANVLVLLGRRRRRRHPVGRLRRRRRLPAHADASLPRHPGAGCGRLRRQPGGRRLGVRRHRPFRARQRRRQDGPDPAGRRPGRLGARGLAVRPAQGPGPDRPGHRHLLRGDAGGHRRPDADRGRRHRAQAPPHRRARAPRGAPAGTPGCTGCRSRCAFASRCCTSARFCRSASASSSACSRRSWGSAAASPWCRR